MILPPRLRPGDKMAVFSPSSPATVTAKKRYQRGKSYLEKKGFVFQEGILTGKQDFYRSGSIVQRTEELNRLIHNDSVKCIMAAIGGMNSNSLLPYIDYEYLAKHPKIIIGYSDVTALLLGIYARTGLVTFYGLVAAASFGELPPFVDLTWQYFQDICMGNAEIPWEFPMPEFWTDEFIPWDTQDRGKEKYKNQMITVSSGKVSGRLIGGNLNTMEGFWGSPYMPEIEEGDILFIEDSLKDAATVERSFSLLKVNGVFDKAGGILLGKHEKFDDCQTGRKPYQILQEVLGDCPIPVLAEFDCCHTHPMLTMPLGCRVELDADMQKVTLLENPVL